MLCILPVSGSCHAERLILKQVQAGFVETIEALIQTHPSTAKAINVGVVFSGGNVDLVALAEMFKSLAAD